MPRKGTRSSTKALAKRAAGASKPKTKPRGVASALAETTEAASAAIQSLGAFNAPSPTRSRPCALFGGSHEVEGSHSAGSPVLAVAASSEGETRPSPSQADPQAKAAGTASDPDTGPGQQSLPLQNLHPVKDSKAESVFWAWVLEQEYQRQELDQLNAEPALSSVLDQHELRIEFAHLIAGWVGGGDS
ncbi:unnamed protein product [Phytophthora fragariaefolia]|uniref:Unnamed protein product n=1 Tax=Phytophthora fragariaefolia TaxID=1490495 RepID=A0A9W6YBW4_9STRA|nr:unnamed protein product [Phytophthora fragariaefolia]